MATQTRPAPARASVRTTIAVKIVMALSGITFILFVLAHLYGNLKIFGGPADFEGYALNLRQLGEPTLPYMGALWLMRSGLILALVAHVWSASYLWRRANGARTSRYSVRRAAVATLSSKTMRWGGITLLLFIVFHLMQFTFHTFEVGGPSAGLYDRVYNSFQAWWVVAVYLAALAALGMHLRHGAWSALQTLGLTATPGAARLAKAGALALGALVALGYALPPLSILLGII
jgi:succinate dehydrogenase / fumarate reductase cytochrome b subunit